ncbi:PAS domain-containing protein [Streptomyces sp. T1317-0309]|nr:PAS domain-containing protein [Streptomyces sp. T1317-0309]
MRVPPVVTARKPLGDAYAEGVPEDDSRPGEHRLSPREEDLAILDALFNQSPVGVAVYDTGLRVVRANSALERTTHRTGFPMRDCSVTGLGEVLPDLDTAAIESRLVRVLETGQPVPAPRCTGAPPPTPTGIVLGGVLVRADRTGWANTGCHRHGDGHHRTSPHPEASGPARPCCGPYRHNARRHTHCRRAGRCPGSGPCRPGRDRPLGRGGGRRGAPHPRHGRG